MEFQELKNRITISEIAEKLGYKLNASAGKKYLEYRLYIGNSKIDEIIVYNNSNQTYFSRNGIGDKGDLINFVHNRLNMFSSYEGEGYSAVHDILTRHIGTAAVNVSKDYSVPQKSSESFNLQNYEISKNQKIIYAYLGKIRKLSSSTISDFLRINSVCTVSRKETKKINVAFPFRKLGNDGITNFELRNFNSFKNEEYKGFCTGGDKTSSCWSAVFSNDKAKVKNVYIGESALDMMALYEILPQSRKYNAAFISVGGNLVYTQIEKIFHEFPNANVHLAFDNDAQGNIYDVEASYFLIKGEKPKVYKQGDETIIQMDDTKENYAAQNFSAKSFLQNKNIVSERVIIIKPQKTKDWNDFLKDKKSNENENIL